MNQKLYRFFLLGAMVPGLSWADQDQQKRLHDEMKYLEERSEQVELYLPSHLLPKVESRKHIVSGVDYSGLNDGVEDSISLRHAGRQRREITEDSTTSDELVMELLEEVESLRPKKRRSFRTRKRSR